MASLLRLAEDFQRSLDRIGRGGTSAAADTAGWDLYHGFQTTMQPFFGDPEPDTEVLEPIILRTTLAESIVLYLERFPWVEVTVQMLEKPPNTVFSPVGIASEILRRLYETAELSSKGKVSSVLFKQVHPNSHAQCPHIGLHFSTVLIYPNAVVRKMSMHTCMNAGMVSLQYPECSGVSQHSSCRTAEGSTPKPVAGLRQVSPRAPPMLSPYLHSHYHPLKIARRFPTAG